VINLIRKLRSLRNPPGFHAISIDRDLDDFEGATMLLSALRYRNRIGPISLFTDEKSMSRKGISDLAASGIYNSSQSITKPEGLDAETFWAWPKIVAMAKMTAPCVAVDIDAVLGQRPSMMHDVVGLHPEPADWEVYSDSALRRRINAICGIECGASVTPINTAVLMIRSESLRRQYANTALQLMWRGSAWPWVPYSSEIKVAGVPVTQMVMVEQYLAAAIAAGSGFSIGTIGGINLSPGMEHYVSRGDRCDTFHLWNSKRFYREHARARELYTQRCMTMIANEVSSVTWAPKPAVFEAVFRVAEQFGLPVNLIEDPNGGVQRWSHNGEWHGPGEAAADFSTGRMYTL
jgi:hypothetical protein